MNTASPDVVPLPFAPQAGEKDTVLVAGVMRSGQTWLCFMLAHALNARFLEPYCLLRGIVFSGNEYVRSLTQGKLEGRPTSKYSVVVKTHEPPDRHFSLTRRVVLIVRDPRDTITSAALRHHVMVSTGSDVEEDAQELSLLPTVRPRPPSLKVRIWRAVYGNRLLGIALVARRWRTFHESWLEVPFCHIIKYEDLLQDPVNSMGQLFRYLEVQVTSDELNETLHKLSMGEIKRHHAATDPDKRIGFRKGQVGDFRNHLSSIELAVIRRLCGRTAKKFGYNI